MTNLAAARVFTLQVTNNRAYDQYIFISFQSEWLSVLRVCFETVALCVSHRDSDIAVVLYNSLLHRGAIQ